ncbi:MULTISPECIES: hypothetical protein [unclassified Stygiolobus]|uniref:hypothetical protein n=1 Tax=unclassified Stygiolobus TaxID=2824672 RepID=UPI00307CD7BA
MLKGVINSSTTLNLPQGVYYYYVKPLDKNVIVLPQHGYFIVPFSTITLYEIQEPTFKAHTVTHLKIASLPIDYVTAMQVYYAGPFDYLALGTNTSELLVAKYFYFNSSFVVMWRERFNGNITAVAISPDFTASAVYFNNRTYVYVFYTSNGSLITIINQWVYYQVSGGCFGGINVSTVVSPLPLVKSIAIQGNNVFIDLNGGAAIVSAEISPESYNATTLIGTHHRLTFSIFYVYNDLVDTYNDTIYSFYTEYSFTISFEGLSLVQIPSFINYQGLNLNLSFIELFRFLSNPGNVTLTVNSQYDAFLGIMIPNNVSPNYYILEFFPNHDYMIQIPDIDTSPDIDAPPIVTPSSNGIAAYFDFNLSDFNYQGQMLWSKYIPNAVAITSSANGQVIAALNGSGTNWSILEYNDLGQLIAKVNEIGQNVYSMEQLGIGINGGQSYPFTMDEYNKVIFVATSTNLYAIPVGINATIQNGKVILPVRINVSVSPPYTGVVEITYNGHTTSTETNTSITTFPTSVTLYANSLSNSTFFGWIVNGTEYNENPLTIYVGGNTTIIAQFKTQINVTFEEVGLSDTYWFVNISGKTYVTSSQTITVTVKPGVTYTAGLLTYTNSTVTVFQGTVTSNLIVLNFTNYFKPIITCLNLLTPVYNTASLILSKDYWENFMNNYGEALYYYSLLMNGSYKLFNESPQFYAYLQMVMNNPVLPYYTGSINVQPFINNISPLLSLNLTGITHLLNLEGEYLSKGDFRTYTQLRAITLNNITQLLKVINGRDYDEIAELSLLNPADVQTIIPYLTFRNSLIAIFNISSLVLKDPTSLNMSVISWFPIVLNTDLQNNSLIAQLYVPPYYSFEGIAQAQQFYSIPVTNLYYNLTVRSINVGIGSIQVPLNLSKPYSQIVGYYLTFLNTTIINPVFTQVLKEYKLINILPNVTEYSYLFQQFAEKSVSTRVNVRPLPINISFVKITLNYTPLTIAELYLNTTPTIIMQNYVVSTVKGEEYLKALNNIYFIVPNVSEGNLIFGTPQKVNFSVLKLPNHISFNNTMQDSIAFLKLNNTYVGYVTKAKVELVSQANISQVSIKSTTSPYVFLLGNISQLQIIGMPLGNYTITAQTPQGVLNTSVEVNNSNEVINVSLTQNNNVVNPLPLITTSSNSLPMLGISIIIALLVALAVTITLMRRR